MAVVLFAGFDDLAASQFTSDGWSANPNAVVAGQRDGNALRLSNVRTGTALKKNLPSSYATVIVGFNFRFTSNVTTTTILRLLNGATRVADVQVTSNLLRVLDAAGGVVATGSTSLGTAWHYIEFKLLVGTSGSAEVRLNGAAEIATTTGNFGSLNVNAVQFMNSNTNTGTTVSSDFDDLYVIDPSSGPNTSYLADATHTPHVQTLYPDGDGAHTAWTPDTGTSHYVRVNETTPDSDTSYVSDSTVGDRDSYSFGGLHWQIRSVAAVKGRIFARTDGANQVAVVTRPGSTDHDGAAQTLTTSYAMYSETWETNPDTSAAWTAAAVNGAEFGIKLAS